MHACNTRSRARPSRVLDHDPRTILLIPWWGAKTVGTSGISYLRRLLETLGICGSGGSWEKPAFKWLEPGGFPWAHFGQSKYVSRTQVWKQKASRLLGVSCYVHGEWDNSGEQGYAGVPGIFGAASKIYCLYIEIFTCAAMTKPYKKGMNYWVFPYSTDDAHTLRVKYI